MNVLMKLDKNDVYTQDGFIQFVMFAVIKVTTKLIIASMIVEMKNT